jgi:DNA-binding IclR family transcriptional regulator
MTYEAQVAGALSASKALALLRAVSNHHPHGVRLTDLIALTGMDRSTAHRLLACLMEEGFVDRLPPSKLYLLGIEAMQLGMVPAGMVPLVERFQPMMQRLAQHSGDTVFLVVRSGDHALCLHREEGAYPVKAFVIEPGMRRLLGLSSVGVGILARLPDAEVEAIHGRLRPEYLRERLTLERLRARVHETRRMGFSQMTDQRTDETRGVGCAVRLSSSSYAGVSLAAINARMSAGRRRELGALLRDQMQPFEWAGDGG